MWQPIKTADPRAEHLLLYNGREVTVGMCYEGVWLDLLLEFEPRLRPQPTYWMPLPKAPEDPIACHDCETLFDGNEFADCPKCGLNASISEGYAPNPSE